MLCIEETLWQCLVTLLSFFPLSKRLFLDAFGSVCFSVVFEKN